MTVTDDYQRLFLEDAPLIDVRAPVEFAKGSFPGAVNLPLLTDDERHAIGIMYKEQGQEAAIRLGHLLVNGETKAARVAQWVQFARQHPRGRLFCFRGGLRSHIAQQWMAEAGVPFPLVKGGYKALRRFLIDTHDRIVGGDNFIVISGRTGNGKTLVIKQLENAIDLEDLAQHRGSTFGRRLKAQPSQIDFENALSAQLLKRTHRSDKPVFFEDEGRLIGRCSPPLTLLAGLNRWPVVIIEETLDNRVSNVHDDYISGLLAEHEEAFGDDGFDQFSAFLKSGMHRIRKRLGGVEYARLAALLDAALGAQRAGDDSLHRVWIRDLLEKYYDPMYAYQFEQKESRVVFRGTRDAVLDWCRSK